MDRDVTFHNHDAHIANQVNQLHIHGDQHVNYHSTLPQASATGHKEDAVLLAILPRSPQASFDAGDTQYHPQCLLGTRVGIRGEIQAWIGRADSRCIFWLSGMAGTGKSTIARTIAQELHDSQELGGSFFFMRGVNDLSSARMLITSLAHQLAQTQSQVRPFIVEALRRNPDIAVKSRKEQWKQLIAQPLRTAAQRRAWTDPLRAFWQPRTPQRGIVFVIDALDECGGDTGHDYSEVTNVIQVLAQAADISECRVRILVTSRPETAIREEFQKPHIQHYRRLLHDVLRVNVDQDIRRFLDSELIKVQSRPGYAEDWPGEDRMRQLVQASAGLFIFAATACRLICDPRMPPEDSILLFLPTSADANKVAHSANNDGSNHREESTNGTNLDKMYHQILGRLEADLRNPAHVLGILVVCEETLSVASYARLLGVPIGQIYTELDPLHSVVRVPEKNDAPVRLFHTSFRDFLLDRSRSRKHWIDATAVHWLLAERCIRRMQQSDGLCEDILKVTSPGQHRTEISPSAISQSFPADLTYSCRYWPWHVLRSDGPINDDDYVDQFLRSHLLHWLEALGWLGRISDAIGYLQQLQLRTQDASTKLQEFLEDARRLVLQFRYIIDQTPLQIYYAGLVFAPSQSIVRETFDRHSKMLSLYPEVPLRWGAEIQKLEGHSGRINAIAFSPDGRTVASCSNDNTARLWSASTGEELRQLVGHHQEVTAVTFLPDGKTIVSGSKDDTIRLWNTATGDEIRHITFPFSQLPKDTLPDPRPPIAFSPDRQTVASGSYDGIVRLWNWSIGKISSQLVQHDRSFTAVTFSPDGKIVASGSEDGTVSRWNAATGKEVHQFIGHNDRVTTIAFWPDGQIVATGSSDRTVRLWNMKGNEVRQLAGHEMGIQAVAVSPDGQRVASASWDTIRLWDAVTGNEVQRLIGHSSMVTAVTFSPDSQVVISGSWDKTVRMWNVLMYDKVHRLTGHNEQLSVKPVFSPDGQTVATGSEDKTVRLWNAVTGKEIYRLTGHNGYISAVAFSSNGQTVASASKDKTVRLWNTATGEEKHCLSGHSDDIWEVAFSPDGQTVASASGDHTVRLWNTATGEEKNCLSGHSELVFTVAFSPDGQTVASASGDETVRLWNTATGKEKRCLSGHSDEIWKVTFSPDGQTVASASADETVRLWNATTGHSIHIFHDVGYVGYMNELHFTNHGRVLETDRGKLDVQKFVSVAGNSQETEASNRLDKANAIIEYDRDGQWVHYRGEKMLWLPAEYRGWNSASCGRTLVIGPSSGIGAVSFFRFQDNLEDTLLRRGTGGASQSGKATEV